MVARNRIVIQQGAIQMRSVALMKKASQSAVVNPDIFSTAFHLVAFNVKLNSIVNRTKFATNENYVLIHAFVAVSVVQTMTVMCSIRHALPTLIVLHTKLEMGTNVLIRV